MKTETVIRANVSSVTNSFNQRMDTCDSSAITDQSLSRASYMCRKCKVHGKLIPVKRHKRSCLFLHCKCIKCLLVDQGRKVVAKQIALYRDQRHVNPEERQEEDSHVRCHKVSLQVKETINYNGLGPHCRRCRNHNSTVIWKNHKKSCPFRHCPCDPCRLINVRKDTEKTLRDMQIVTDEAIHNSRGKSSYPLYGSYSRAPAPTKSPNASYHSNIDKSNFDHYSRSSDRGLSPGISAYYNSSAEFLGNEMHSAFPRLTTTGSTTGELSHLANISSPFANSDRFSGNVDLCSSAAFKSFGSGFMMNGRSQSSYQSLENHHPDMWSCLNPVRSMVFSPYNVGPEYCSSTYSYLNSLGMSSQEPGQAPLAPLATMMEPAEPDNSSGPSMYRNFPDYCY